MTRDAARVKQVHSQRHKEGQSEGPKSLWCELTSKHGLYSDMTRESLLIVLKKWETFIAHIVIHRTEYRRDWRKYNSMYRTLLVHCAAVRYKLKRTEWELSVSLCCPISQEYYLCASCVEAEWHYFNTGLISPCLFCREVVMVDYCHCQVLCNHVIIERQPEYFRTFGALYRMQLCLVILHPSSCSPSPLSLPSRSSHLPLHVWYKPVY